ncbi:MAG: hypothetical protein M1827_004501 [Pycnora praestabilis]|nr:MAG: hypothetical protein M1827_004501 [Pycnora praestabilis]
MASATDIITYIGVPLAVLGVLPILFTCLKALLTLDGIRRELARNGLQAITRGSLLTGIVEIEIPRCSITPLERDDEQYWKPAKSPSAVRGGTWTIFNWDHLVTGHTLYRLQYKDDLRQPQAEVDFEELIAFLLDRGAVPDVDGFRMLRTSGLWTPTGTRLLLSPDTLHHVLKVAIPDDSDGILSLSMSWSPAWDRRDIDSLPPYWVRLEPLIRKLDIVEEVANSEDDRVQGTEDTKDIPKDEKTVEVKSPSLERCSSARLRIGPSGVLYAFHEEDHAPVGSDLGPNHLKIQHGRHGAPGLWFACAATVLASQKGMGLWSYTIPEHILSFSEKDSVPCGVMVLLGVIDEKDTPAWASPGETRTWQEKCRDDFFVQSRKRASELSLPPEQRKIAQGLREAEERAAFFNRSTEELRDKKIREEKRFTEALVSSRLDNGVIAEANLKWLKNKGEVEEKATVRQAVEGLLYRMLLDEALADSVSDMLDKWKAWSASGGMNRAHFDFVKKNQVIFSHSSCILSFIRDFCATTDGSVTADLQESIRVWRKVRLG